VQDLSAGQGVPDVLDVVHKARCKRKYMVQEKVKLPLVVWFGQLRDMFSLVFIQKFMATRQ